MRKPTLTDALAKKAPEPEPAPVPVEARPVRLTDQRINTTLRIEPDKLEKLKIIAARKRIRVNDLLLEGVDHVLGLHAISAAA